MNTTDDTKGLQFDGRFSGGPVETAEFVARVEFHKWDPASLAVNLYLLDKPTGGIDAFPDPIRLVPTNAAAPSVELSGIRSVGWSDRKLTLDVWQVAAGITNDVTDYERKFEVIVKMRPSGILVLPGTRMTSYTGDIETKNYLQDSVVVNSKFGQLTACSTYEYQTTVEHDNTVTKQIQRTSLMGSLVLPAGTAHAQMHQELLEIVGEVGTTLSLCYRQKVDFYEVSYLEHTPQGFKESFLRRRLTTPRAKPSRENLINVRDLVGGGLESLINKIRALSEFNTLQRAIGFLAASSDANVETAYFMAFSAMEAIVNGCLGGGKAFAVEKGAWKKIEKLLRKAIDTAAVEVQLPLDSLKVKLPELRRLPLEERVSSVCGQLNVTTHDLWSKDGFAAGLARAASVRNGLFHMAGADENYSMYEDLVRVRILAERILLKHLNWPDDKIWVWYDQELRWVN